jgi:hypothetical protein
VNRSILPVSFVVALAIAAIPSAALAQNASPPPTPAQIEKAKKAFQEGKKLHEQKKLPEAIAKFKESYDLSKNPLLLYNIGFTMDEALMEDLALYYYRKFLADAPADAAQRAEVEARVKVLEAKFNPGGATTPGSDPNATKPDPNATKPDPGPKKPLVIKPPGTYSATDFQHEVVDVAPPAKPLDITAFVPEDSGFVVTLYYRTAGEGKFASKEMRWRYKELVGRVPAPKMIGDSVQYYIEAKDATGAVIAKSGKSTSPNLVTLEANAPQRFYPDFSEDGEAKITEADIKARDEEDDPLNRNKKKQTAQPIGPVGDDSIGRVDDGQPGRGFTDVGSQKFTYMKWGSSGVAVVGIGFGIAGMLYAGKYAKQLEDDYELCGAPPCKPYDSVAADWQSTGKMWQTISNVGFVVGGVGAVVAGYYWYKSLTSPRRYEAKIGKAGKSGNAETTWVVLPQIDASQSNFIGGTAATRF